MNERLKFLCTRSQMLQHLQVCWQAYCLRAIDRPYSPQRWSNLNQCRIAFYNIFKASEVHKFSQVAAKHTVKWRFSMFKFSRCQNMCADMRMGLSSVFLFNNSPVIGLGPLYSCIVKATGA